MISTSRYQGQWPAILPTMMLTALLATGCADSERATHVADGGADAPDVEPDITGNAASQQADEADRSQIGGPDDYDAILEKYVEGDYFDYSALKNNPGDMARFNAFLRWQAQADADAMSRDERIAFYINAYNACCIKAILDHYPVTTPKEIDGFFDGLTFTVAGEELTIEEIEYERLIADHKDMRAHFAVVCADRGCLPLKDGAYTGETLDKQLEQAARRFVNDPRHFRVDKEEKVVRISRIFDWYGKKFLKDPERPVDGDRPELYLANWADEKTKQLLQSGDYQREFIEWDWTLNEKGVDSEKAEDGLDESK